MHLNDLIAGLPDLTEAYRPIRLRLSQEKQVLDDVLLVKRVTGGEVLCGGLEYRLQCVSTRADLPLKEFIALPVELQFVTDRGELRAVCGIVAQAAAGQSDGGLATYELVMRDALALMEQRTNTRVFRNLNELDITQIILDEWRQNNSVLAKAFDVDWSYVASTYPAREFTMQHNESDADFLRRLWKRRGIAWFMRPGQASESHSQNVPAHSLVLFDDAFALPQNAAGTVRYHRDDGTEQSDTIVAWNPVRTLIPGSVTRQSWDYLQARPMSTDVPSRIAQGTVGNKFAFSLDDYLIDVPHAGDDSGDYRNLGELRMKRHEYESKCFHGEGSVRAMCVGQWIALSGHPEIDTHPAKEREFVVTRLDVDAENNLPKTLDDRIQRLFCAQPVGSRNVRQRSPASQRRARHALHQPLFLRASRYSDCAGLRSPDRSAAPATAERDRGRPSRRGSALRPTWPGQGAFSRNQARTPSPYAGGRRQRQRPGLGLGTRCQHMGQQSMGNDHAATCWR
jgi:type VI secretion system secreted protein VgrG